MFVEVEGVCVGVKLHHTVNWAGRFLDEQKDTFVEETRLHVWLQPPQCVYGAAG